MTPLRSLLHAFFAFSIAALHVESCDVLSAQQCADTCVPLDAGTPGQSDFRCGDWWINAACCNGTEKQLVATSTFFKCTCDDLGMTTPALAVISSLVLITCIALFGTVFYVLHRKKRVVLAEEQQRDKAVEEAQHYLPR